MSYITPQVDVGSLTLNGLTALTPLLSVLSADNVDSLAMVQMENLGSLFHINGKYARQLPDLLQRCKSTRVDRLGLLIGWRKGDAASLMAQSAGGQAVALLSMCLSNLYRESSDIGQLLSILSKNALAQSIAISSPSQLVRVARALSSKLETLGFGNILASQVVMVYDAYKLFGKPLPRNFLDKIPLETMAELLPAISRAVREESIVARITGSRSMGHILAIVMIMFPEDTFVTLDNVVVFEGPRKSILVEFTDSDGITNVALEWKLQIQSTVPILPIAKYPGIGIYDAHNYFYNWRGCIADMLQVMFMEDGIVCPEPLRIACCGMLEPLSKVLGSADDKFDTTGLVRNQGVIKLLGMYPRERIDKSCQKLWRIPTGWSKATSSLKSAFDDLVLAFAQATPTVFCTCDSKMRCYPESGWKNHYNRSKMRSCPLYRLWGTVGDMIGCGFSGLFVDAGENATIHPKLFSEHRSISGIITELLNPSLGACPVRTRNYNDVIHICVKNFCGTSIVGVAASSNSSTVFLAALQTPQLPTTMSTLFILMEGNLIFNGRYHPSLVVVQPERRQVATKHIQDDTQLIIPSSIGAHSNLMMTILEDLQSLKLTSTIRIDGYIVHLSLDEIILASWELNETEPCEHSAKTPLESRYADSILTTSVASPLATQGKVAIVQVSQNPVAQLLSCVFGHRSLLLSDCCLNCAYEEAVKCKYDIIIV